MDKKTEIVKNDKNHLSDEFYVKFKSELEQAHSFPTEYLFKYILPADQSKIAQLHSIFDNANAQIFMRDSKKGNYISLTVKAPVNDAHDVVIYYRQAMAIEGIVAL